MYGIKILYDNSDHALEKKKLFSAKTKEIKVFVKFGVNLKRGREEL